LVGELTYFGLFDWFKNAIKNRRLHSASEYFKTSLI